MWASDPGLIFGQRDFLKNVSLGGGGGGEGASIRGSLYNDEYLRFENAIFCSSNCNFLKFSAHNMSLLLISSLFHF